MTDPDAHNIIADPQAWILLKAPTCFFSTRNFSQSGFRFRIRIRMNLH